MTRLTRLAARALPLSLVGLLSWMPAARTQDGYASEGQMGLQAPVTPVAEAINNFYDWTNILIIAITLFVLVLLAIVIVRFNEKSNPTPSKTCHHTLLEVAWTVVPIFILVAIAIPSFQLLNLQHAFPKPDITIKATGFQWYWSHQYPDQGGFAFESYMLKDDAREALIKQGVAAPRLLAVDNEVVVPVNKVVHVLVTGGDVIHAWAIPSFGSKVDAVPGRLTATWFKATKPGVYYGQCSELCGKDHSFMPIAVRVVSDDVFAAWAAIWQSSDKKREKEKKARELLRTAALDEASDRLIADARR